MIARVLCALTESRSREDLRWIDRWARGRLVDLAAGDRARGARAFVATIEEWNAANGGVDIDSLVPAAHLYLLIAGRTSGLVASRVRGTEDTEASMRTHVLNVIRRAHWDAKAIAVALLKGWGLSAAQARDRLKDKDLGSPG